MTQKFVIVRTYPEAHFTRPGEVEDAGEVLGNTPMHIVEFVERHCSAFPSCCGYHIKVRMKGDSDAQRNQVDRKGSQAYL